MKYESTNRRKIVLATVGIAAALSGTSAIALPATATAQQSGCSDVQIIFARGSGELPGLGIVGQPFSSALTGALAGKTVDTYAVNYAASVSQLSAPQGGNDITRKVTEVAAACPATQFVLGGYSQGATAVSIALGVRSFVGGGNAIPASLAPSVAAVVTFGDPLGARRQTIASQAPTYADRAKTYCASGDPVCGGGVNFLAHINYTFNGNINDGANFAAGKITTTAATTPATTDVPPVTTPAVTNPATTSPLGSSPLGSSPLGSSPLGQLPFGSSPLGSSPLGSSPLGSSPFGQLPFGQLPFGNSGSGSAPMGFDLGSLFGSPAGS